LIFILKFSGKSHEFSGKDTFSKIMTRLTHFRKQIPN